MAWLFGEGNSKILGLYFDRLFRSPELRKVINEKRKLPKRFYRRSLQNFRPSNLFNAYAIQRWNQKQY